MKKVIATVMILTLMLSFLASCGDKVMTTLPEGMSGKEAASLMLAKERLNSQLLHNSGNIFESGSETLANLAEIASVSLASKITVGSNAPTDASVLLGKKYEALDGSFVEVDGATFKWSGFLEYSNSYDYFLNLTNGISSTARIGADLIDSIKKNVRVVDTWVNTGGEDYYLHVEKNREVLYSRDGGYVRICIRTKTEDGSNLYEVYNLNEDGGSCRMVYSEGKLCEYSYIYNNFNHNFLAVNNKGFWEVIDVGATDSGYNVSCMVIKNDICYDGFYDPISRETNLLKVISADRATDIMQFASHEDSATVVVNLQGFSGHDYIELKTTEDRVHPIENSGIDTEVIYYYSSDNSPLVYQSANTENIKLYEKRQNDRVQRLIRRRECNRRIYKSKPLLKGARAGRGHLQRRLRSRAGAPSFG